MFAHVTAHSAAHMHKMLCARSQQRVHKRNAIQNSKGLTSTKQLGGLLRVNAALCHGCCVPLLWAPANKKRAQAEQCAAERRCDAHMTCDCAHDQPLSTNGLVSKLQTTKWGPWAVLTPGCADLQAATSWTPCCKQPGPSARLQTRACRNRESARALQHVHMGAAHNMP